MSRLIDPLPPRFEPQFDPVAEDLIRSYEHGQITAGMIVSHVGDNRSGKTFTNAIMAYFAWKEGLDVWANCPQNRDGSYICILNFPHYHYKVYELSDLDLIECYVLSDESLQNMDARTAVRKEVRDVTYWQYQVIKRGIRWHYDTVITDNMEKRVRRNPTCWIETFRYPREAWLPLRAIKMKITPRYGNHVRTGWILKPWEFYPLYNHVVLIRKESGGQINPELTITR